MIENILYICLYILLVVMLIPVVATLVCAIQEVYACVKKTVEKRRVKKLIKDSEQKATPCHCGGHAYIEHRLGEFYHIGCTVCPVGFTDEDIPKLVKMWNDVQSIKAGDLVDTGIFTGRVKSISYGEATVYANIYDTNVSVPLQYIKKIKPSSAKVV